MKISHQTRLIHSGEWIPFGFSIDGNPAKIERIGFRKSRKPGVSTLMYDVRHLPLRVWLRVEEFPDVGVATCQVTLRAERSFTEKIGDVAIFDCFFAETNAGAAKLRTVNGGGIFGHPEAERGHLKNAGAKPEYKATHGDYPPREFAMMDHELLEPLELSETIEGRSSLKWLPVWWLHRPDTGMWFGPEWSGSWQMRSWRDEAGTRARVLLPRLNFQMLEGEEIELPAVSFGVYEGDIDEGCRHFRQVVNTHFSPPPSEPAQTVYQLLGGNMPFFTGEDKYKDIEVMTALGLENLVFASCWYREVDSFTHFPQTPEWSVRTDGDGLTNWLNFWETCGAFYPGKERFSEGFDVFVKRLKEKDVRLGLWCDPRVSRLIKEYGEAEDVLLPYRELYEKDLAYNMGLIDLGRREGRRYMRGIMERFVEEFGAPWFWHDINVELCERYWDYNESPGRLGLMELRYMLGMQQVYREFIRDYPEARIEWCASGGTMIDIGTLRFAHCFWVSDQEAIGKDGSPDVGIAYRSRLNRLLPARLILNSTSSAMASTDSGSVEKAWISQCGSAFAFCQGLRKWDAAAIKKARPVLDAYKSIRHLLDQEFNGLFPACPPRKQSEWDGWEFYDPQTGEAVLMLFRLKECKEEHQVVHPKCLEFTGNFSVLAGDATLEKNPKGLAVTLSGDAALIHFQPVTT